MNEKMDDLERSLEVVCKENRKMKEVLTLAQ